PCSGGAATGCSGRVTGSGLPVAIRVGTPVAMVPGSGVTVAAAVGTEDAGGAAWPAALAALAIAAIESAVGVAAGDTACAVAGAPSPGHSSTRRGPAAAVS